MHIAFLPYFFDCDDVVVMSRRVHVRAAPSYAPHLQFLGLSEEKSRGSYAGKYGIVHWLSDKRFAS
jgi:hypothetical protein